MSATKKKLLKKRKAGRPPGVKLKGRAQVDLLETEKDEILVQFIALFAVGKSRREIINILDLKTASYPSLEKQMYQLFETDTKTKSPIKLFSEYVIRQSHLVRDLESLKDRTKKLSTAAAEQVTLGAIKAQSDVHDRVIRMGLDLKVLQRGKPGTFEFDGKQVADMSEKELSETAVKAYRESKELKEQAASVGDKKSADIVALYPNG